MNLRNKIALGLLLLSASAFILCLALATIEYLFRLKIEISEFWIISVVAGPLMLSLLIQSPKLIFFLIALLIPFGTALYGAVTHTELWKEWNFWVMTFGCVAYMFYFLLKNTTQGTIKSR